MPTPVPRLRNAAIGLGLSLALSACVVAPRGYYARGYYGGAIVVAPPAPRVEYYGPPPYPGEIWIAGYWRWGGRRYRWVPGYWTAPRPGYRWMPRRWVHGPRGWHMAGGRWRRER